MRWSWMGNRVIDIDRLCVLWVVRLLGMLMVVVFEIEIIGDGIEG